MSGKKLQKTLVENSNFIRGSTEAVVRSCSSVHFQKKYPWWSPIVVNLHNLSLALYCSRSLIQEFFCEIAFLPNTFWTTASGASKREYSEKKAVVKIISISLVKINIC